MSNGYDAYKKRISTMWRDAREPAPLPHLGHLNRNERKQTLQLAGTPEGLTLAANARAIAANWLATAEQYRRMAESAGDSHYYINMKWAERALKKARQYEAEALALEGKPQPPITSDDAYERYRQRIHTGA